MSDRGVSLARLTRHGARLLLLASLALPFMRCDFAADDLLPEAGAAEAALEDDRDIWIVREFHPNHPWTWGLFVILFWPVAALVAEKRGEQPAWRGAEAGFALVSGFALLRISQLLGSPRAGAWLGIGAFVLYAAASAWSATHAARDARGGKAKR